MEVKKGVGCNFRNQSESLPTWIFLTSTLHPSSRQPPHLISSRLHYQSCLLISSILPKSSTKRAFEIRSCFARHENLRLLLILHRYILSAQSNTIAASLTIKQPWLFYPVRIIKKQATRDPIMLASSRNARTNLSVTIGFSINYPFLLTRSEGFPSNWNTSYRYAVGPSLFRGAY